MITLLIILKLFLLCVEVLAVATLVILTLDLVTYSARESVRDRRRASLKAKESVQEMLRKEKLRREKEEAAHEGFFEYHFVRGFDANGALISRGIKVPTAKAWEYYKKMDELADTQIFQNTEEL